MWSAVVKALLERCRFRPEPDLHEYSHSNITEQVLGRDFGELSVIEQFASGVSASFRSHVPTVTHELESNIYRILPRCVWGLRPSAHQNTIVRLQALGKSRAEASVEED